MQLSEYSPEKLALMQTALESSFYRYLRFAVYSRMGIKFVRGRHHKILCDALERVFNGEINRLIVNIAPGYSKTETTVCGFISWCLAKRPQSRFIHTSSGDQLVLENSSNTKRTIQTENYQAFWPLKLQDDSRSKRKWYVKDYDGGLYAVPTGGGVTGFRAGRIGFNGFSGALIFDDPLKPVDANHEILRRTVNEQYNETVRSRIAVETTPVILIMQRVHSDDLSAYLLKGGSGEKWHHLDLPVEVQAEREYPVEFTHGIPIEYDLEPGPLWEYKHNQAQIDTLKTSAKTRYVFDAQYMQRPSSKGGNVFDSNWWPFYKDFDPVQSRITLESGRVIQLHFKNVYADTAQKTKEYNDFSVFQCFGMGEDGRIYILDQLRARLEAPDLERQFIRFLQKHQYEPRVCSMGARAIKVEDKVSGTGLIQAVRRKGFNVTGIPRNRDKVSRAMDGAPRIAEGLVVLPRNAFWVPDYIKEFADFSPAMTHSHDDQIDPTLDAISDMLADSKDINYEYYNNVLSNSGNPNVEGLEL